MSTVAITPPALTGYAAITQFTLSSDSSGKTNWSLGDGTIASSPNNVYRKTYSEPGLYKVTLLENDTVTSTTLSVFNYLPESISFKTPSVTGTAGIAIPLTISVTSNSPGPYTIDLYAANSYSAPYDFDGTLWSHLNATWKFTDEDGTPIKRIEVTPTSVFYSSASGIVTDSNYAFIGTTATVTAKFCDDLPSRPTGTQIIASKYIDDTTNSRATANALVYLSANPVTGINVTIDGINAHNPFYWQGGNIPYVITLNGAQGIVKFLPYGITPIDIDIKVLSGSTDITSNFTFKESSNQIKKYGEDGYTYKGGYSRNIAKSLLSAANICIRASAIFAVDYTTFSSVYFAPSGIKSLLNLVTYSQYFDIKPLTYNSFRRFNESENFKCLMNDFVNAPVLKNSTNFFDNYLGVLLGDTPDDTENPGQKAMEKISNFAKNHHDVDTANLQQFLSLAKQVDMPVDDFGLSYPSRLARVMDIASCPRKKVWGAKCPCNQNFGCSNCCGDVCKVCGKDRTDNLGTKLTMSNTIRVGTPIVIEYLQSNNTKYELFYPKTIGALSSYALSSLTSISLKTPLTAYYNFYRYIDTPSNNQVEGLINWSDVYTTISESASTEFQWYGDNQILDSLFNLELHRGLNIIDE